MIVWVCILAPDAVADLDPCVQKMEKVISQSLSYAYVNTLGAGLYRAGRFEAAIQRLNEAVTMHGGGGTPSDLLFLAMAHQRLGRTEEARQALDRAVRWLEQAEKGQLLDNYLPIPISWDTRLEFQLLRREAEELIKNGKS
jgi:tetratricopeptide (TPR) repeat protein